MEVRKRAAVFRVIPPEDPLGEDATDQPVLEVIEVFVDVFAIEPSEVFIDATLLHEGMLIEANENMELNLDLNYGLKEMQFEALAHCLDTWRIYMLDRKFVARTCGLHNHMYCADEFDFELAYITTRHIDFQEHFDELMANATHSVSSDSNLSKNELEDDPWGSSTIDNIMRNVMFEKWDENPEANEEPIREYEHMVETMAGIIVISSDDEEKPMEESEIEVILVELNDDKSMEEIDGEVV
ncbi:unnamed protein product [Prunus armeniaca]